MFLTLYVECDAGRASDLLQFTSHLIAQIFLGAKLFKHFFIENRYKYFYVANCSQTVKFFGLKEDFNRATTIYVLLSVLVIFFCLIFILTFFPLIILSLTIFSNFINQTIFLPFILFLSIKTLSLFFFFDHLFLTFDLLS